MTIEITENERRLVASLLKDFTASFVKLVAVGRVVDIPKGKEEIDLIASVLLKLKKPKPRRSQ